MSAFGETTSIALVQPHGETVFYDVADGAKAFPKAGMTERFVANGLTFNIAYEDMGVGFTDPLNGETIRRRFEDVLAYVASVINVSNRTLDIRVNPSEFDGTGALATAGTFYPTSAGIHPGSTLRRLNSGLKPFAGFPEISVTVDVGFAWNIPGGDPPPGSADFFTVLLHEMTHGLGFTSLILPDGSSSIGTGIYSVYDSLLIEGANDTSLITGGPVPTFQADVSSLTGDDVWFNGSQAIARYATGFRVPVYAPNPFEPGSSISHWDLNAIQSPSVMTHALLLGSAQREYAPVDVGTLIDLGYNQIDGAPAVGCAMTNSSARSWQSAGSDVVLILVSALGALGCFRREQLKRSNLEQ